MNDKTQTYDPSRPLDLPPEIAAAFPTSGALHASVWWSLETTHAPPIFHVGAAITFGVLEMARRGWWINEDDPHVPAMWCVMVGDPGIAKSTVYGRYRKLYDAYLRGELGQLWQQSPLVEGEGTLQGLIAALSAHYNAEMDRTPALLMLDEFTRLLNTSDHVAEHLCRLIDQKSIERHLLGAIREKALTGRTAIGTQLLRPAVSGLFCTTPASLASITTEQMVLGGLFSRVVWLRASMRDFTPRPRQQIREGELSQVIDVWHDWAGYMTGWEITRPQRLVETPEDVKEYLDRELTVPLFARMKTEEGERLNAYYLRSVAHCRTIASLYALSQGRIKMTIDDVERAIAFVYLCLGYTRAINDTTAVARSVSLAARVLDLLREHTPKWVYKKHLYKRTHTTKDELDSALDLLIDRSDIERLEVRSGKRGRPGEAYRLLVEADTEDPFAGVQQPVIVDVIEFAGDDQIDHDDGDPTKKN